MAFRTEADKVNDDLEPWKEQLKDHQRDLAVATNEKKLLSQKVRELKYGSTLSILLLMLKPLKLF